MKIRGNYGAKRPFACLTILSWLAVLTPAMADLIDDLQPGHWLEIPDSRMDSVVPTSRLPGDPRAVMDGWSGGAYDSVRDRLVVWGGGHCDYAGNEIYAFDLATMQWMRLTDPSPSFAQGVSYYPDGQPASRHTYDMLSFLPNTGKFVSVGGGGYSCDGSNNYTRAMDLFNFDTNSWERGASYPDLGHPTGRVTAYDPATGLLWVHGTYNTGRLASYDPVADSWDVYGPADYLEIYGKAAIDPVRHQMLVVGGYGGKRQIRLWNLDKPSSGSKIPRTSGDQTLEHSSSVGLEYYPVRDKYVGWKGGASVYLLDPDKWSWSKLDPAPTNTIIPTAANKRGTFGRFRYVPSRNVFIAVNKTNENVFVLRLDGIPSD